MSLIECRSCDEPDCTGCNLHRLAFALRRGLLDACKDNNNTVRITSEVAPVVRCNDCRHLKVVMKEPVYAVCEKNNHTFYLWQEDTRKHFCSWGEWAEGKTMRLIDANALMREFAEFVRESNNSNFADVPTWNDAVSLLGSAPTIAEWIPCSERLPDKSGQYYVSGGDKVWICKFLIIPNFTGGWCNDASSPVVQAWMPLPEPYREDGDNVRSD